MAQKQEFTQQELTKMSKQQLCELAQSFHMKTEGQSKTQVIKQILGLPVSMSADTQPETKADTQLETKPDTEVFEDAQVKLLPDPQAKVVPDPTLSFLEAQPSESQMKYKTEMRRLELDFELQKELQKLKIKEQKEFELQKLRMEMDFKALELTSSSQLPQTNQSAFKVETASKLLPKLGSDSELEVYLITFKKIATLNNWPKEHWSAVLQTQLKGKALRIFAELPDNVVQDFDQLQSALLTAYELSPEHYRKRFRDIRKSDSENYTDFAFKMQNYFKRWLNSLDSFHDIDKLRQTLLMEQFLETVSVDLKIWLVDQKPKNVDEMARLADQYVALRKQSNQGQKSSTDSQKASIARNMSRTHDRINTNRTKQSVVTYMLDMRERIAKCSDIALQIAESARSTAKTWYDRNARSRHFDEGDLVLVLLPVTGKPLQCKYQGPYRIVRQLGPVDYVIATPDKRKTERTCHVNMLKPYVQRNLLTNVHPTPETINTCTTDIQTPKTNPLSKFKFDGLTPDKQEELKQLLTEFSDVFSDEPGKTTVTKHEIHLEPGSRPIKLPPYRVSTQKSEIIKKELDNMIDLGVIEPSSSPWAAPVVVIPKPDKTFRFCVDYRRLNEVTVSDAFPMPRIDDLIDKVGKAKYLTKIDLSKGYWQVPMDEEAIPMSAFVTPFGHFQWKFMPFGLRNAPATFQKLVQKVLLGLDKFTAAYLDDILIFSESWHEHICHIKEVLKRIRDAGLTIKATKCDFATAEVDYLGHTIGLGKVAPRNAKVLALQNFPRPNNRKQLQSFLGLAGYYRKFLPHFAHITACLTNLLKKGARFVWDEEAEAAFLDLKSRLASRPILRPPDFSRPFCVAVDASDLAVGACLFQEVDGVEHPIAYYSKKLNDHQRNYSVVEKEALALT